MNHSLVAVLSVWPPGLDLPRREWVTLHHFTAGQGCCAANLVRWKQSADSRCSFGEILTMSHIVNDCNDCITAGFPGGLSTIHLADEAVVQWLGAFCKS